MEELESEFFVTLEVSANTKTPSKLKEEFGLDAALTSDDAALRIGVLPSELAQFWSLGTRGYVNSNQLVDHLRWMADRLAGNETLRWAQQHESVQLYANGSPQKWHLDNTADAIERARLGIPLTFVMVGRRTNRVHVQTDEDPQGAD